MTEKLLKISLFLLLTSLFSFAGTLDDVKKAGVLKCGVSLGLTGFSELDSKGIWRGLDVDFCKALSATVLGDASKVKYIPLSAKERFEALKSGKIDILSRNTTNTESRDTTMGIDFVGTLYYDGQGFLIPKALGINSAKELDGATICIPAGTTTELNLDDYFKANKMRYKAMKFEINSDLNSAFEAGKCDVITGDISGLYSKRLKMKEPEKYAILSDIISKEPLAPAVRDDDSEWFNIAKWVRNALITAEELNITSSNVDEVKKSRIEPESRRVLGVEGRMCQNLSLDSNCFYRAIKQVGNYQEIFERNVGTKSSLLIERGLNSLWNQGGILYSPPFR